MTEITIPRGKLNQEFYHPAFKAGCTSASKLPNWSMFPTALETYQQKPPFKNNQTPLVEDTEPIGITQAQEQAKALCAAVDQFCTWLKAADTTSFMFHVRNNHGTYCLDPKKPEEKKQPVVAQNPAQQQATQSVNLKLSAQMLGEFMWPLASISALSATLLRRPKDLHEIWDTAAWATQRLSRTARAVLNLSGSAHATPPKTGSAAVATQAAASTATAIFKLAPVL